MTKTEEENLMALKVGFEMNEWEDFLLVLNEIRDRDKELIGLYRNRWFAYKDGLTKSQALGLIRFMKNYKGISEHTTPEFILRQFLKQREIDDNF